MPVMRETLAIEHRDAADLVQGQLEGGGLRVFVMDSFQGMAQSIKRP